MATHWNVFDFEMLIIVLLSTEPGRLKSELQALSPDWPRGLVQSLPLPKAAGLWAQYLQGQALSKTLHNMLCVHCGFFVQCKWNSQSYTRVLPYLKRQLSCYVWVSVLSNVTKCPRELCHKLSIWNLFTRYNMSKVFFCHSIVIAR